MAQALFNGIHLMIWLQKFLYLWVKSKSLPLETRRELNLDSTRPVCYVMRTNSITDLMVLDHHCRINGLPRPHNRGSLQPTAGSQASYIYLVKSGLVQIRTQKDAPSQLFNLVQYVGLNQLDVQIVPVSVIWGRNPGSEDKSILKLLSFDHENAGILQRIFTVIFHGRNVICNFGLPISTLTLVKEGAGVEQTTRKLRRVLRVHFRSQRVAALGPQIYDRNQLIVSLLKTKAVEEAILDEARKKKISEDRARERAKQYIDEIAASPSAQATSAFEISLRWLFQRIFSSIDVRNGDRVRRLASNHEVIYLPCHRSHMDYLLIGYSIYNLGVMTPHIAAGINLNFWPIGSLLRHAGAFFIRRTFKGNRLYSVVFNEYVLYLLNKGYSLKFFPEGGRSRTGRLLQPKTGMMNMVIQGFIRNPERPVVLIPVYVGYDKVLEEGSYLHEMRGKKKKSESMSELLKARKFLARKSGKAYINFGEPLDLGEALSRLQPNWRNSQDQGELDDANIGTQSISAVQTIAKDVMVRINNSAVVSPTALVALALLASPKKAMPEADLLDFIQALVEVLRRVPYHGDLVLPDQSPAEQLAMVEEFSGVARFKHPDGDVIHIDETEAIRLTYYRNNVLHTYALPALIASFFQHNDQLDAADLLKSSRYIYPFLKDELFLRFRDDDLDGAVSALITAFQEMKILVPGDRPGMLRRPDVASRHFNILNLLGRCLGRTIERHAVCSAMLSRLGPEDSFNREEFEVRCQQMAQRIALLNGTHEPDFNDKALFHAHFDLLRQLKHIVRTGDDETYRVTPGAHELSARSIGMLSHDLRQSISRSHNSPSSQGSQ